MRYKALSNIKVNGEQYKANDIVELTDEAEAASLVTDGIVEALEEKEPVVPQPPLDPPAPEDPPAPTGPVLPHLAGPMVPTPTGTTPAQVRQDLDDMEGSSSLQNDEQQV